jgi:tRNA(Ile)-lysidine synthase
LFLPGAAGQTDERTEIVLVRPLLDQPKARLIATLAAMGITFADDPSNRDPRFTRPRLRALMPALADEGLDARRLALLADRLRRADATIECAVDAAILSASVGAWDEHGAVVLDADKFARLPAEVALRLLGRAIGRTGDEGPLQLGKLEALYQAICSARIGRAGAPTREPARGAAAFRLRRTLAGALVTLARDRLQIEPAPPRASKSRRGRKTLTTRQDVSVGTVKRR